MAAWSCILRAGSQKLLQNSSFKSALLKTAQARCMSEHRTMVIRPSIFTWHKTKDWVHFYFFLGIIPVSISVFLINVFIGPATLTEIPEGYVPKEWEYLQHPIKRFFQRYLFPSPQQEYEKYLHYLYEHNQIRKVRLLENRVKYLMGTKRDYRGPYFKEFYGAKYIYIYKQEMDKASEASE